MVGIIIIMTLRLHFCFLENNPIQSMIEDRIEFFFIFIDFNCRQYQPNVVLLVFLLFLFLIFNFQFQFQFKTLNSLFSIYFHLHQAFIIFARPTKEESPAFLFLLFSIFN